MSTTEIERRLAMIGCKLRPTETLRTLHNLTGYPPPRPPVLEVGRRGTSASRLR